MQPAITGYCEFINYSNICFMHMHYDVIIGAHGFQPDNPPPIPDIRDVYITL